MATKRKSKRPAKKKVAKSIKRAAPKKVSSRSKVKPTLKAKPRARPAAPVRARAPKAKTRSRFVWFDLMAADPQRALEFYRNLFGWQAREVDVPAPMNKYVVLSSGDDFGGVARSSDPNAPSTWCPYVLVDDVDAVTRKASAIGGSTLMPPTDIPNVGRFSVVADPSGGIVAPLRFNDEPKPAPERGLVGPVTWCELLTNDTSAAGRFYTELFGWGRQEMDMGDIGKYHLFKSGDRDAAGMGQRPPVLPSSMWITYFSVDNVDAKTAQAKLAGARELVPPSAIPNMGRFSWLADPQGGVFALFHRGA